MTFLDRDPAPESTAPSDPLASMMFVVYFAVFVGGLALMGTAFDQASGLLFGAGLVASGLAFLIPLQLSADRD